MSRLLTNYHKCGGLKEGKFILSQFRRTESPYQSVGRATFPLETLGEDPSSSLLVSGGCIIPIYVSAFIGPSLVCLCLSPFAFSLLRTPFLVCSPSLMQDDLIAKSLIYQQRPFFQVRSHSDVPGRHIF